MIRSSTITYGPFEGRSRHFRDALPVALIATLSLASAVSAAASETLQCTRPRGGALSCEIESAYLRIPAKRRRVNTDCRPDARYRAVGKGAHTVLVDGCGMNTAFGYTTFARAEINTEQVQLFLRSQDSSTLRIDVPPSYFWVLVGAFFGLGALRLTAPLLVRGCRDLGAYRIRVRPPPGERREVSSAGYAQDTYRVAARLTEVQGPCLRVTSTILGIPVRVGEIAVPLDLTEVGVERGPVPALFHGATERDAWGGRLVLRTAAGAVLPVIPELRRGVEVHERARVALAKALGVEDPGDG